MGACDAHTSYAFDFEFTSADGFTNRVGIGAFGNPVVQLAFAYSLVTPVYERPNLPPTPGANSGPGSGTMTPSTSMPSKQPAPADGEDIAFPPSVPLGYAAGVHPTPEPQPTGPRRIVKWVLQRRLRVTTVPLPVATRTEAMFKNVDPETCCTLLVHKVLRAASVEGADESRTLLRDWLVLLMSCCVFSRSEGLVSPKTGNLPNADEVLTLLPEPGIGQGSAAVEELPVTVQPLPRLIYGLLHSPLLRPASTAAALDRRAYLESLMTALAPEELSRAIYPCLSSFADPDTPTFPRHTLCKAALTAQACNIFLLDSYKTLTVYYAPSCPRDMPFPPPANSLLRRTVQVLRSTRRITPEVAFMRAGVEDTSAFEADLIEEARVDTVTFGKEPGYEEFIDSVLVETRQYVKENFHTQGANDDAH